MECKVGNPVFCVERGNAGGSLYGLNSSFLLPAVFSCSTIMMSPRKCSCAEMRCTVQKHFFSCVFAS